MLYKPNVGRIKDSFVMHHAGKFYLFSMYMPTGGADGTCRDVWLATSDDGVHWNHVGSVIQAPFIVFAMAVHRYGDKFLMNHGSFTQPHLQNVIRFWESDDLVHWRFLGHETDLGPDTRFASAESRLDCMDVVPVTRDGRTAYYGYATGPGGFLFSNDGLHWTGLPQPTVDWDLAPPPPTPEDEGGFEIGGCEEINGRFYLAGGWFNYMGAKGYGVYTLVADSPTGPFRADLPAYRLTGQSSRWVAIWARFVRGYRERLINSYMYDGHTYEMGQTYLPPLKTALVDNHGHLRLGYWTGNDKLKVKPIKPELSRVQQLFADGSESRVHVTDEIITVESQPEAMSHCTMHNPTTVAILDQPLNFDPGIILEATIQITCKNPRLVAPSLGIYLEETPTVGTAAIFHSQGLTHIGRMTLGQTPAFDVEDIVSPGCAAPAGLSPHRPHTLRILMRRNMFELYLDDLYVQTFNTSHRPGEIGVAPKRIGFIAMSGIATFSNVRLWQSDLKD